jgi:hypothetical protein
LLSTPDCAAQRDIRALACHAVILSGAKNLALDFSAEKQQGEMLRCHSEQVAQRGGAATKPKVSWVSN